MFHALKVARVWRRRCRPTQIIFCQEEEELNMRYKGQAGADIALLPTFL